MKKLLLLFLTVFLAFILISCEDSTTDPLPVSKGSINLSSTPSGAVILVDNQGTGKTTPAVITDLDPGIVTVTLQFAGYRDTTFTMNVVADMETPQHVTLTQNAPDLESYQNIKLYEVISDNLSGLDLSTGERTVSNASETDIYFDGTNGIRDLKSQHLRSATTTNRTYFYLGSGTNIEDGTDSPVYQASASWGDNSNNSLNYMFLYDKDDHYSKLVIVDTGQDGPVDRYVIIRFMYNNNANDVRF
jgi:hypothetical protein